MLAQTPPDTLVRLLQSGRIALGAQDSSIPLSYLDANGRHVGYHVDVCLRIVEAIRLRLELPAIQVVTVPTTVATRLALLNNGSIDIECAHNPVRSSTLSQALLSHATMVSELRFMSTRANVSANVGAKGELTMATLGGKNVGMVSGGSAASALRLLGRAQGRRIDETFGRLAADTFGLLVAGRVDAVVAPLSYLLAQRALAADPDQYVLLDGVLLTEPVALMFRLQDEELHALGNQVLAGMMKSGEMTRLYEKWFNQPIPGVPRPLGIPMPTVLKAWFAAPGSELQAL